VSSLRGFGTRVTPQRERKYNSANYACHRKLLSAARICEIVSPPSLQKYIATRKIRPYRRRHRARSLGFQGERIRELRALASKECHKREKQRKRKIEETSTYLFFSVGTLSIYTHKFRLDLWIDLWSDPKRCFPHCRDYNSEFVRHTRCPYSAPWWTLIFTSRENYYMTLKLKTKNIMIHWKISLLVFKKIISLDQ